MKTNTNADITDVGTPAERSTYYMDRAKQLSLVGGGSSIEMERLLREVYKALSFVSNEAKHYMFLAKIFKQSLDITSAIFCYRYALKLEPSNFAAKKFLCELLVLKGKELMVVASKTGLKSKYQTAKACFDESLEVNREDFAVWILKSVCHVSLGELPEAFEAINRVIKPNKPLSAEVYILRAKINWGRGLVEQGNADIRIASSIDPNHPEVLNFASRSFLKAEKLYKECIKAFVEGNMKEALGLVKHALFITGEDVKLHIMLSKIYRCMGDLQDAYSAILKAKEMFEQRSSGGDSAFVMEMPADIHRQINLILNELAVKAALEGNYDKAILLLNKIIKSEKTLTRGGLLQVDHKYHVNRGDCYRALHKLQEAIYDYELALKLHPQDWEIMTRLSLTHYLVATDFYNSSDFVQTEKEMDKAIKYNPKVSEYYALRGQARYYNSDYQLAYEDFKKTVELDDTNEVIKQKLVQFDDTEFDARNKNKNIKNENVRNKILPMTITNGNKIDKSKSNTFYVNELQVLKLHTTNEDMIEMMLHPQATRKLPIIKMLSSIEEQDKIQNKINYVNYNYKESVNKSLPRLTNTGNVHDELINETFINTQNAVAELERKEKKVDMIYNDKQSVDNSVLWGLVDTAKALAREMSHPYVEPPPRLKLKGKHKKTSVSVSTSAKNTNNNNNGLNSLTLSSTTSPRKKNNGKTIQDILKQQEMLDSQNSDTLKLTFGQVKKKQHHEHK